MLNAMRDRAGLRMWACVLLLAACAAWLLASARPANALDTINVRPEAQAIDLTASVDEWPRHGDRIQISTAPGADGIVRRIEVRASETGRATSWVVFALSNNSDEQLDRILVAPHFRLAGSGVLRPDLGSSRIVTITPSQGFRPERQEAPDADIFLVTLDPGTVVTYVVELTGERLPQLRLWEEQAYKDKANSLTLYQGMVLGISGLLALFLTILFVVRGTMMFPAAAAMAWAVLAYMCIDFGFWHKLFSATRADDQVFRAGAEAIIAGSLVLFFFVYLGFGRWRPEAVVGGGRVVRHRGTADRAGGDRPADGGGHRAYHHGRFRPCRPRRRHAAGLPRLRPRPSCSFPPG